MAIDNQQAVTFSNEFVRIMADQFVSTYDMCTIYKAWWDARNLAAMFPDSAAEVVSDGAPNDGRPPMTGQLVQALYAQVGTYLAWGDAVVGGKKRIDWFRNMSVNGRPRFRARGE